MGEIGKFKGCKLASRMVSDGAISGLLEPGKACGLLDRTSLFEEDTRGN